MNDRIDDPNVATPSDEDMTRSLIQLVRETLKLMAREDVSAWVGREDEASRPAPTPRRGEAGVSARDDRSNPSDFWSHASDAEMTRSMLQLIGEIDALKAKDGDPVRPATTPQRGSAAGRGTENKTEAPSL